MRERSRVAVLLFLILPAVLGINDRRWPCNRERQCYQNHECPTGHYRILLEMPSSRPLDHCVCTCVRDVLFSAKRRLQSKRSRRMKPQHH
ncbi:unnamed protein product [Bursaphelenchus xylophilus]|uniref:(pine wood nematode) hypothetical protein n=1 Tax=Bursaphelenchus xylophilus TaxID=6326 RepID=A0A1I7RP36_BURXY|nr:unnamed protein product [Bursaphelenchus xylophilus]CAG9124514.1 unnamed protein product [Bursaphelenchus xylophilus]